MKISDDQIQEKKVVGTTKDGNPVVYILTKGGLHAFFGQTENGIEALAAAPHIAIAKYFAEKKHGVKWNEIQKSKAMSYTMLRDALFNKEMPIIKSEAANDRYFIYVTRYFTPSIEIMSKSEVIDGIKSGQLRDLDMVRPANFSAPIKFIEDSEFASLA